jgi:polysaccharide biosynthesis protein PslG
MAMHTAAYRPSGRKSVIRLTGLRRWIGAHWDRDPETKKMFLVFVLATFVTLTGISLVRLRPFDLFTAAATAYDFQPPASAIPRTLFGLNINQSVLKKDPWPTIPFGSLRLWDSGTGWSQLNPAQGKYDWELLDKWFDLVSQHDNHIEDILFTFGRTPRFASSTPDDSTCGYTWSGPGQCGAPSDVRPDGSGTDQFFKDFVTAIATHNKKSRNVHIKYWELWNEPYAHNMWSGTIPQLVRMARDASQILKSIDPDAVIVAPCLGINVPPGNKWLRWYDDYLSAGGADTADIMSFHGYIHYGGHQPGTRAFADYYKQFYEILSRHHLTSKPIWDTEASWGETTNNHFEDEDQQAAFVSQFYLLHWSYGVPRLYWYAYNQRNTGALWAPDSSGNPSPGHLTKAGQAFVKVEEWLVGASLTGPCQQNASVMTCNITRGGHAAQIVWAPDGDKNISPQGQFKKLSDLDGNSNAVTGQVRVGNKPVLLEAQ